jgi:hypothetical protein
VRLDRQAGGFVPHVAISKRPGSRKSKENKLRMFLKNKVTTAKDLYFSIYYTRKVTNEKIFSEKNQFLDRQGTTR